MKNTQLEKLLAEYNELSTGLKAILSSYKRKRKIRLSMRWLFGGIAACCALIMIFLLLERTPVQSEGIRYAISFILYLCLSLGIGEAVLSLIKGPGDTAVAVEIEEATKKFNSGLSSAAEFIKQNESSQKDNTSDLMKRLTVASVVREFEDNDLKVALKKFSRKKYLSYMALLIAGVFVWYSVSPSEVMIGSSRLLNPFANILPWTTLEVAVTPQNTLAAVGQSIEISAVTSRKTDEPVLLQLYDADALESNLVIEMYKENGQADSNKYLYVLSGLQNTLEYSIKCEKYVSPRYKIIVMPQPQIKNMQVTLYQPAYVSNEVLELPANTGDYTALAGTKVKIAVKADQKLKSGGVKVTEGEQPEKLLSLPVFEDSFTYEFNLATHTLYSVSLESEYGLTNENPVVYRINAKLDEAPTVELLKPGIDIPFPKTKMLELKAVAKDDYGVNTMILYYALGNRKSYSPLNMKSDFTPVKDFEVEFPWMLDTVYAAPGTRISYYVEVEDAKKPQANVASTSVYYINMPSMHDLYMGEDEQHKNLAEQLQDYIEVQKDRREALLKAYEQIKHEEKLDYETEKAIEDLLKKGAEQQKQADDMIEGLKKLQKAMENNPFNSPEALEKMSKVSELFNELLDDKTKNMMQELQKSLSEMKVSPEDFEKYQEAFKTDEYIKNLDRTIDLLTQVREQQKFNSLANSIEDIYARQQQIASETDALNEKMKTEKLTEEEEAKLFDLEKQQNKINSELAELQKQAEELTKDKKNEEFSQNSLLEDVKNIRDKMQKEDYAKRGESIEKSIEKKDLDSASKEQQNMLKFLEALKRDAMQINETMMMSGEHSQLDLSSYIRRALQVSDDQERLYEEIKMMPSHFLRGEMINIEGIIDSVSVLQVLVKQQGAELEYDLENFIKSSFSVDPSVVDSVRQTQRLFSAIVKNLEDRALETARTDQLEIIRNFNKLAIDLMRAQDESGKSGSSSPMSAMQQFKNLTKRQLRLYQQMLKQQMMPGGQTPEQLRKMSLEQRYIREALEKLMREGQKLNSMGRMDDVIKDMQDLETEILDKNLQKKVAEKQKSIYDRMLKAQKAIKNRDEESEERSATKSREIIRQELPSADIENVGSDTRDLSKDYTTDLKEDFPDSYKTLLDEYYKSLNIYGGSEK